MIWFNKKQKTTKIYEFLNSSKLYGFTCSNGKFCNTFSNKHNYFYACIEYILSKIEKKISKHLNCKYEKRIFFFLYKLFLFFRHLYKQNNWNVSNIIFCYYKTFVCNFLCRLVSKLQMTTIVNILNISNQFVWIFGDPQTMFFVNKYL